MLIEKSFITEIKSIFETARQKAYAAVNVAMVDAYWQIGKRIFEEEQQGQQRANYGEFLIHALSKQLAKELGNGFSIANLKNFRQFYLSFPDFEKGYALRSQLSWTHYRLIMRVENIKAREYYLNEVATQKWSTRVLERNINTLYYERLLSTQNKQEALLAQEKMEKIHPADLIKDPYVLEFLGMNIQARFSENDMESAIISNLQQFLLELGKGFSFVGRQYRITTDTKHFYIDLVFYNYILKCFVLIDLKINELSHQDIGQMDMYVRMFEDRIKTEGDNPTIGIILCTEKDQTIVKYSVLKGNEQLFASKYRLVLPTEEELRAELEREKQFIREQIANKQPAS
ncbi:PDDEXK nuclease domain-containing protein [Chitinophaga sp. CC14]|uniref:PDDEXK nuclease domain-containing protein n=1 Tax=Chitinophaga TaxID=79328 RepID=UPI000DB95F8D|nr:PDDEXK nuclease domain-containing protein [Chitinophaga ginsengisegetis]MDR6565222.1 putative nuclease of restriction endonuclease-like (RecB) superfamily [Chitinophaga ginsengisegetis]MDR6644949.1 putative nuclease of restriction endonuclease-like (RecB) superfamily [Chitinophaga ginsengisegetis]MDR6652459.1 putative nuclease of restriction endonuclease-like (RecB) superfamily [Chitinophaga ginsengisegetis]